jgi:hypothetical protein
MLGTDLTGTDISSHTTNLSGSTRTGKPPQLLWEGYGEDGPNLLGQKSGVQRL